MVNPILLCNTHLLAEHGEIHKHLPSLRRGVGVHGRFYPVVQIQLSGMVERHDALAEEMVRRGMNHLSPLTDVPDFGEIYPEWYDRRVDVEESTKDLWFRCDECRERIRVEMDNKRR